jgi:hypothetical protein
LIRTSRKRREEENASMKMAIERQCFNDALCKREEQERQLKEKERTDARMKELLELKSYKEKLEAQVKELRECSEVRRKIVMVLQERPSLKDEMERLPQKTLKEIIESMVFGNVRVGKKCDSRETIHREDTESETKGLSFEDFMKVEEATITTFSNKEKEPSHPSSNYNQHQTSNLIDSMVTNVKILFNRRH